MRAGNTGNCRTLRRPKQSWQFRGLNEVEVDVRRPIAIAACLRGVTRVDEGQNFQLGQMMRFGGQGCILLERLIHEIAYKVAKALKYGA